MSILQGTEVIQARMQPNSDLGPFLAGYITVIETNWQRSPRRKQGKTASEENWRFKAMGDISEGNPSNEKRFEKAVAALGAGWANQVPTASGLWDHHADRHRNVDVVRKNGDNEYTLIELKIASDDPWYATKEVLSYAVLYAFARRNGLVNIEHELLKASKLHLWVLAPGAYYQKARRQIMNYPEAVATVNRGLKNFETWTGVECSFDFNYRALALPEDFNYGSEDFDPQQVRQAFDNADKLNSVHVENTIFQAALCEELAGNGDGRHGGLFR